MTSLASALREMPHPPALGALVVGALLLLFGRRLFWLFVGAAGFTAGLEFATRVFHGQSESMILIAALVLGLLGMIVAFFLQKLAISLGGFLAGAYLALSFSQMFLVREPGPAIWIVVLVGGIIGLVLMHMVFNGALIVLSSILGASLLVHATSFFHSFAPVALLVLVVLGIFIQSGLRARSKA